MNYQYRAKRSTFLPFLLSFLFHIALLLIFWFHAFDQTLIQRRSSDNKNDIFLDLDKTEMRLPKLRYKGTNEGHLAAAITPPTKQARDKDIPHNAQQEPELKEEPTPQDSQPQASAKNLKNLALAQLLKHHINHEEETAKKDAQAAISPIFQRLGQGGQDDIWVGGTGAPNERGLQYTSYLKRVLYHIKGYCLAQILRLKTHEAITFVLNEIWIQKDGILAQKICLQQEGDPEILPLLHKTLKEALPLPSLPDHIKENPLGITLLLKKEKTEWLIEIRLLSD